MSSVPRDIKEMAKALVETAHAEGVLPDILRDVHALQEATAEHPGILRTLSEITIPLPNRQAALQKALKGTHPYLTNVLLMIQRSELLEYVEAFFHLITRQAQTIAQHFDVHVTSAVPLEDDERKKLQQTLKKIFGGTHELREQIDKGILGGLVIEIGDRRYDASIKGKIDRLTRALAA